MHKDQGPNIRGIQKDIRSDCEKTKRRIGESIDSLELTK